MSDVIVYLNASGGVSVVHPSPEAVAQYGVMAIALKDVPFGRPFKIINVEELPDRSMRPAWSVEVADLTDGVGAEWDVFPEAVP
jgi:hypothetical protein